MRRGHPTLAARRALIVAAATALAAALAGCAGAPDSPSTPGAAAPTPAPSLSGPATPPAAATPPAGAQVTVRILPDRTTVSAGEAIPATVRIANLVGHPIAFGEGLCNGKVPVGIASARIPFDPPLAAVGCAPWLLPAKGLEYRATISTSYDICSPGGSGAGTGAPLPRCKPGGGMPPLPVGTYRTAAAIASGGTRVSLIDPVTIELTR